MMFKHRFHPQIKAGLITRTYRQWKKPQVKAGGFYKLGGEGFIEVHSITRQQRSDIVADDLGSTGIEQIAELEALLPASDGQALYCVDFSYAGKREDLLPNTEDPESNDELESLARALVLRDRNSKTGPFTHSTLLEIYRNPGTPSATLSKTLKREQAAFKQDVRKLKKLGMTISLESGYRLSKRGEAFLRYKRLI